MGCKYEVKDIKNKNYILVLTVLTLTIGFGVYVYGVEKVDNKDNTLQLASESPNIKTKYIEEIIESTKENVDLTKNKSSEVKIDWNLTLVNSENKVPDNYIVSLENIDQYRKFDSRAIDFLNKMLSDMKKDGIKDIWVQSAYRSIESQYKVFEEQVQQYMKQGKSREEAEELTQKEINKPGYSEHNLGLAVDFNYVNNQFENTKAFVWLKKNAEKYGFILRYEKEKENITGVEYEPWHWRYVGEEHAKKINEMNMCLEEYIDFLKK